jgi:hypothetical protein
MAENESFFRKVVRFVANPTTDWTDLNSRQPDTRELELEKSELKAMIERKRRNDFVRKREFDMLRRVRREGLSPEQLAALGGSSRLDDSEARLPAEAGGALPDAGVKAKIDAIEQQMVGDGFTSTRNRAAGLAPPPAAPTRRAASPPPPAARDDGDLLPPLPPLDEGGAPRTAAPAPVQMGRGLPPLSQPGDAPFALEGLLAPALPGAAAAAGPAAGAPLPLRPAGRAPPVAPAGAGTGAGAPAGGDFANPFAVEVSEVAHDPELDEAVIAFANADFAQCEDALRHLTSLGGPRAQHAETWLVLFDLYRATGQSQPFESLAVDYAQQFGWSAPQWYSLPRLVAEAQAEEPVLAGTADTRGGGDVGWICPEHLDLDSVARLRSQTLQMPLPWVFDWARLQRIDAEAAMQLSTLFRLWGGQALELRWVAGNRLFGVLAEAAPTGVRDADPAFWLTRLDALRLANRADQFDEAAIDYCVTYEVSPPSWEPARCKVILSDSGLATRPPSLSMVSEVSTSFQESGLSSEPGGVEVAHVELSGQLVGDISATLNRLNAQLGTAPVVSVSCARLIRVDFIAAGDLLNWVLSKRNEGRGITFYDAHRLVALFFGAMGINEHAKVQLRKV